MKATDALEDAPKHSKERLELTEAVELGAKEQRGTTEQPKETLSLTCRAREAMVNYDRKANTTAAERRIMKIRQAKSYEKIDITRSLKRVNPFCDRLPSTATTSIKELRIMGNRPYLSKKKASPHAYVTPTKGKEIFVIFSEQLWL